jgi:hypothetical protein
MTVNRFAALAAVLAVGFAPTLANATCPGGIRGVWHLHANEAGTGVGAGSVIRCVLNIAANGNFTAPCTVYEAGQGTPMSTNVSGKFTLNSACDLTGTLNIPGDSQVKIGFGHVNGNAGAGTATQGAGGALEVLHFTLIKK